MRCFSKQLVLAFICLCFTEMRCQQEDEIQNTFELLNQGEAEIEYTDEKDVTLVFGPTGSGKSTFVQWIAGDNTNLISKETFPDSDEYLIEDLNDRIGSSTVSKTLFPELIIDIETTAALYDLPGFSDTRSSSHDIAASFFIKKVTDHAENVKLVFLTSYHTVRTGVDRTGFTNLLRNIDDLIKDVDKFKDSVLLVVSKVDNIYVKKGSTFVLTPDSTVLKGVADFLNENREFYNDELKKQGINEKERNFMNNAIKIINILLTNDNDEYSHIALFRRPDEPGPLSEIPLLIEGKQIVQQKLFEKNSFTHTEPTDFGFTVSDNSKLGIINLVAEINAKITVSIDALVTQIQAHFKNFVEPMLQKLSDGSFEVFNFTEAREFPAIVNDGRGVLSGAVDYFTHLTEIGGLGEIIARLVSKLGVEVHESIVEDVSNLAVYFEFFQFFREEPLPVSSLAWANSFQSQLTYLTDSKQFIKDKASSLVQDINDQISSDVDSITDSIKSNFMEKAALVTATIALFENSSATVRVNESEALMFHFTHIAGEEVLGSLADNLKRFPAVQEIPAETLRSLSFLDVDHAALIIIAQKFQEIEFLEIVSDTFFSLSSTQWSNSFQTVSDSIQLQTRNILTIADHSAMKCLSNIDLLLKHVTDIIKINLEMKLTQLEVGDIDTSLENWLSLVSTIEDEYENKSSLSELADDFSLIMSKIGVFDDLAASSLRSVKVQDEYLKFLSALKGDASSVSLSPNWNRHVNEMVFYLEGERNFNDFVVELYETLAQYSVQRDVSRFDVMDPADWGTVNKEQGIRIDQSNFELFLSKLNESNFQTADRIRAIVPSMYQLTTLNSVLRITLKNRVKTQCPVKSNTTIVLLGNFIKFSDFLDSKGKFKECGWQNISSFEIYAFSALFIDQDLLASGHKLKLSIIAPKWEVIDSRKILLDGTSGISLPRAANGTSPGGHGKNGSPGVAGGSAGAFLGVASLITNSQNLTISSNGGPGATGQSGGHGMNSLRGRDAIDVDSRCVLSAPFTRTLVNFFRLRLTDNYEYRIHAIKALNGGNAGFCGVGGLGGLPGLISVIDLSQASRVVKRSNKGEKGVDGYHGSNGAGNFNGYNFMTGCKDRSGMERNDKFKKYWEVAGSSAAGNKASGACFSSQQQQPSPPASFGNEFDFVTNFTVLAIENSNDRLVRHSTKAFSQQIAKSEDIRSLQNTQSLIDHLKMLESFAQNKSIVDLASFYESHLETIDLYAANPRADERSDEFKKVLGYLYTATLVKISNLKKDPDSDQIIDINGYLDIVLQNVKTLGSLQDDSRLVTVVETLKKDYKSELDKKIEEARILMEQAVFPEFDAIGSEFEIQLSCLVDETIQLQNAANTEKVMLIAKKEELKRAMRFNILLKVFKAFGKVMSFFGTIGAMVGKAIDVGTSVTGSLTQGDPLQLPSLELQNVVKELEGLGNSALDMSASIKKNRNNIAEVTQGITDLEKTIKDLENFEKSIFEKLVPMIEKMGNDLITTAANLESKSRVSLDVTNWQVQGMLKETSFQIQQFTKGFEVQESLARSVEKLEEVMNILIKVHDRIQEYQEQQRLAVYMAQLSSASVKNIVVSNARISNSFRDLQISIRANIILNQYHSVLNAFKQWIFPFAATFLKDFQLPAHLVTNSNDIEGLALNAAYQIEDIKSRIQKYKSTVEDFDEHLYFAQFNGSSVAMKPFHVWKNDEHRDMITRLLAGDTVHVKADVANSPTGKDAIKFNYIELGLKSSDSIVQAEVNRNLLNYGISMTHLGNSYYRYKDKYFSIASSSQTMHYAFEKNGDGSAMYGNNVYLKLLKGDIMLSPYTMWELRLTLNQFKSVKSFGSLSVFWDKVDLVFEGRGSFVNMRDKILDVESYYNVEDSICLLSQA